MKVPKYKKKATLSSKVSEQTQSCQEDSSNDKLMVEVLKKKIEKDLQDPKKAKLAALILKRFFSEKKK